MPDDPVLTLSTSSLFSKWGFSDGDEPDWLLDVLDERGIEYFTGTARRVADVAWHDVLYQLVVEYLVPVLRPPVTVYRIHTNHNPVRVATVAGVEVPDEVVFKNQAYDGPKVSPDHVEIPLDVVIRRMGLEIVTG